MCPYISSTFACAGERLVEELAPELAPMLASLEMPANFVPVTNAVLAEMARRGIGRQQILTSLRKMGTELPQDSVKMMQVGCCITVSALCMCLLFPGSICRMHEVCTRRRTACMLYTRDIWLRR